MRRIYRRIIGTVLHLTVLALVALAAYYPIVLEDAIPVDQSALYGFAPWQEAAPADAEPSIEDQAAPLVQRYYPWYVFLHESARRRELPLWNPYEHCGMPFFALWRTRCLSPFLNGPSCWPV